MESNSLPYTTEWTNESHIPEALSFLRENFDRDESVLKCMKKHNTIQEDEELMWKDHERILEELIASRLCLIVRDVITKKIIGAGVIIVYRNPKFDDTDNGGSIFQRNPPKTKLMERYCSYLSGIIDKACLFERFSEAKVSVELYAVAVDKNYRQKGLATAIFREQVSFAKDNVKDVGFIFALCTSKYTTKVCEKLGFQNILEEDLLHYKDELGRSILQDTHPHNVACVTALKV